MQHPFNIMYLKESVNRSSTGDIIYKRRRVEDARNVISSGVHFVSFSNYYAALQPFRQRQRQIYCAISVFFSRLGKYPSYSTHCLVSQSKMFRKSLYKPREGPSTRPIVLLMITGSYCRRRMRFTIFWPDEITFLASSTLLRLYMRSP